MDTPLFMSYSITLEDYRNKVKGNLSLDEVPDNLEWSNNLIDAKIHEARRKFWNKADYHSKPGVEYVDSVINQEAYDIPSAVDNIKFVRFYDGTSRQLCNYMTLYKYLMYTRTVEYGFPFYFTRVSKKIRLYPIPTVAQVDAIEFIGDIGLSTLVENTDVDNNIEDRFQDLITKYATGLCWTKAEQYSQANNWFNQFEADWRDNAFDIKSEQTDQAIDPSGDGIFMDELNQHRYGHLG